MLKLSEKYGPLMSLKFGNVPTVVASSPETVKDVLKTFDADCCSRPYLTYAARISYNLNDLAFSPYSKYWREVRRMTVLELYTAKRVQSFRHIREEEVASLVEFVKGAALLGNTVNLSNTLMKLSGSVICRVGFGINLKGSKLEDTYEEIIRETMEVLGSFAAADYLPIIGRIIDRVTGLHSKCEKQHMEDESLKDDIIALLLKMERGEAGLGEYQLTRNHTKGILLIPVASLELLLTSDLHVETDEGEKAKSVKRASVSDGETKANCFQRIWSEEDEIALLQGIVDYKETSGLDPFNGERKALYDLLKPHISVSVTSVQFFQKIRTLKKKFKKEKNKGSKPNNQKLFHLSKLIWGDEEISYAEKDELKTGEGRKRSVFQLWRH
ncbi:unnamed protein product [Brassica rapa]|uniref:Glabrous enhancer-binding protein-like DBD domain-containing protein n=2 Tax=Brassica TaxID=3705 RepID=A0A8D9GUY9_BRACM|nr:unnamed protein product [Brassica napus]CAG7887549.1 unnamed protein product [Brassica rapa]